MLSPAAIVRLGGAGVNVEEKGVYYPVDKAADWPLQFAIRLGGAALQFIFGSPVAAEVASQVLARLETRDSNRPKGGCGRLQPGLSLQ